MGEHEGKAIAVVGATGLQGSAVTRRLLQEGWRVRALTRNPDGEQARALAALGAEVIRAGRPGVTGAQPRSTASKRPEPPHQRLRRRDHPGQDVADAVARTGNPHLVYASAGTGMAGTGIGSWETKVAVTEHLRRLGMPLGAPAYGLHGADDGAEVLSGSVGVACDAQAHGSVPARRLAVRGGSRRHHDRVFSDPDAFVGRDLTLVSDVQSIEECRAIWRDVTGRPPRRFRMPTWLFERFSGTDETTMWRWLRDNHVDLDTQPTRDVHPWALTVKEWLIAGKHASRRGGKAWGADGIAVIANSSTSKGLSARR